MKKIILSTCALFAAVMTMSAAPKKGTVRYLNFKPEVASVYEELAAAYERKLVLKLL